MKSFTCEKISEITANKKKLEKVLNLKLENKGKEIFIDGKPEDEYIGEKVIGALDFGFSFSHAVLIKINGFIFEIINIKDHTRRKDLERIRARIIGTKGKTLKTITELTGCYFEIKDNLVGIIGAPEYLKNGQEAVIGIIRGAKHSNVYSFLEKHQVKEVIDLGLKE